MARQKSKKWSDYLWLVSATYFTLGFFNIVFAWLGVICFMIPLFMAVFGGGKGYCNNYCGRGQLFLQIGNTLGWSRRKAHTLAAFSPARLMRSSSVSRLRSSIHAVLGSVMVPTVLRIMRMGVISRSAPTTAPATRSEWPPAYLVRL